MPTEQKDETGWAFFLSLRHPPESFRMESDGPLRGLRDRVDIVLVMVDAVLCAIDAMGALLLRMMMLRAALMAMVLMMTMATLL
eukprot:316452-Pyramimonas_sp.AAC.1